MAHQHLSNLVECAFIAIESPIGRLIGQFLRSLTVVRMVRGL